MPDVVAVGDSLLAEPHTWGALLARAIDKRLIRVAVGGARVGDVIGRQLPQLEGHRYDIACLSIGCNDVRDAGWLSKRWAGDLETIVKTLAECSESVVVTTVSLGLRQPPFGLNRALRSRVQTLDDTIRAAGATTVSAEDLRAPRLMELDLVHLTPLGHGVVADRAADALGLGVKPSLLVNVDRPVPWPIQTATCSYRRLRSHFQ